MEVEYAYSAMLTASSTEARKLIKEIEEKF